MRIISVKKENSSIISISLNFHVVADKSINFIFPIYKLVCVLARLVDKKVSEEAVEEDGFVGVVKCFLELGHG